MPCRERPACSRNRYRPTGKYNKWFWHRKEELENTIYELILGECSLEQCLIKNAVNNLDVLPSNVNLAGAEIDLIGVEDREYILKIRFHL